MHLMKTVIMLKDSINSGLTVRVMIKMVMINSVSTLKDLTVKGLTSLDVINLV